MQGMPDETDPLKFHNVNNNNFSAIVHRCSDSYFHRSVAISSNKELTIALQNNALKRAWLLLPWAQMVLWNWSKTHSACHAKKNPVRIWFTPLKFRPSFLYMYTILDHFFISNYSIVCGQHIILIHFMTHQNQSLVEGLLGLDSLFHKKVVF